MVASLIPCLAAVVAAPLLKLWPEYGAQLIPAAEIASLIFDTRHARVRGLPSSKRNSGPGPGPLSAMQTNTAETGHSALPVLPTK